jgi:hypothetical protein
MATKPMLPEWHPTPDEVERILVEMRPIIEAFARRDRKLARSRAA